MPTNKTPWSRLVLQLLKTPLEYFDQLLASTATAMGLEFRSLAKAVHPLDELCPLILNDPELDLQVCLTAL